ncbi:MAG: hypothetical protein ACO3A2_11805, partial [Bdellovibrionia bacterium]
KEIFEQSLKLARDHGDLKTHFSSILSLLAWSPGLSEKDLKRHYREAFRVAQQMGSSDPLQELIRTLDEPSIQAYGYLILADLEDESVEKRRFFYRHVVQFAVRTQNRKLQFFVVQKLIRQTSSSSGQKVHAYDYGLKLAQQAQDVELQIRCLLGLAASIRSDSVRQKQAYQEALTLAQDFSDRELELKVLFEFLRRAPLTAHERNSLYQQAFCLSQKTQNTKLQGRALLGLAWTTHADPGRKESLLRGALRLAQSIGDQKSIDYALDQLRRMNEPLPERELQDPLSQWLAPIPSNGAFEPKESLAL